MGARLLIYLLALLPFIVQQIPAPPANDEPLSSADWAAVVTNEYSVYPALTYLKANNYESKLDVYTPTKTSAHVPTVIYIHGGGWVGGSRNGIVLEILPYLEMGWAVVNLDYRLANVSPAPAAVEDCRCALKWVIDNAKTYQFDTDRIIVTGRSAGGHLALMTALLTTSANLDWGCYYDEQPRELKVAAVINWYGPTDVADLAAGPNLRTWAASWLGANPDRLEIAKRVSPLNYVRKGLPPILTIHGDADPIVPYAHALRFHESLEEVGTPNQLLTIKGGGHGKFSRAETDRIFAVIRHFLKTWVIKQSAP